MSGETIAHSCKGRTQSATCPKANPAVQRGEYADAFSGMGSDPADLRLGTLSYVAVVALLRYFGKVALSKLNAFDIVVTVDPAAAVAAHAAVRSAGPARTEGDRLGRLPTRRIAPRAVRDPPTPP
jgi:hypothetical protein